jgi:glycosyltransferase involved in cell wall biosynthesis
VKIALAHPFPFTEVRRGGERYLWDLAWYLGTRHHHVDVFTGTAGVAHRSIRDNVTFHMSKPFLPHLYGALLTHRFDVVHALTPQAAIVAKLTAHRVVYTSLGAPTRAWLKTQPGHALEWFVAAVRMADEVTALSQSAADAIAGVTGRRPIVLPPGVRLDRFVPGPKGQAKRVLFASDASVPAKRARLAVEAVAKLGDDVRLQLGGPGDVEDEFGVVDVLGVGAPDDMPARYQRATVTVLPSVGEAFGLVALESLACGTPVVCADSSGPREIVDDCGVGVIFRTDDVDDLARALRAAMAMAGLSGTVARCVARAAEWGWEERVGPAHEALYGTVRGESRTGRASNAAWGSPLRVLSRISRPWRDISMRPRKGGTG